MSNNLNPTPQQPQPDGCGLCLFLLIGVMFLPIIASVLSGVLGGFTRSADAWHERGKQAGANSAAESRLADEKLNAYWAEIATAPKAKLRPSYYVVYGVLAFAIGFLLQYGIAYGLRVSGFLLDVDRVYRIQQVKDEKAR